MNVTTLLKVFLLWLNEGNADSGNHGHAGRPGKVGGSAKGEVYYRGTKPDDKREITTGSPEHDDNLFVADEISHARNYGKQIERITLSPDAKILKEGTAEFKKIAGKHRNESMLDWSSRIIRQAKSDGYDVVHFRLQGTIGTVILNPGVIVDREVL